MKLVEQRIRIAADPRIVYELLTDPAEFVRWMADSAEIDARPGGTIRWTHPNGDGTVLHLVHRGLVGGMADAHAGGWSHYLGRLARAVSGHEPGRDPWADRRVASAHELA